MKRIALGGIAAVSAWLVACDADQVELGRRHTEMAGGPGIGGTNDGPFAGAPGATTSGGAATGGRTSGGTGAASVGGREHPTGGEATGTGGTHGGGAPATGGAADGGTTVTGGNGSGGAPETGGHAGVPATGGNGSGGVPETGGRAGAPATGGNGSGGVPETGGHAGVPETGGHAGVPATGGAGGVGGCEIPVYSSDCSEVPFFECGYSAVCEGNVLRASWHQHILCGEGEDFQEIIQNYECTYPCSEDCYSWTSYWPDEGEELVQRSCVPTGGQPRRVFVTSDSRTGDFGGVAAGDAWCQGLADAQDLGGTWKAWLSDAATSPAATFTRPVSGYVAMNGAVVAADWEGLATDDGSLWYPILMDETHFVVPLDAIVWSNTDAHGDAVGDHCGGWLSTTGVGVIGGVREWPEWSALSTQECSSPARIYCFEQ
ncbi:MAG: hypothetical protein JW751_22145 [Polyangiaceae bacterium]|nr:hypothetical protein [Polyangiaceae bacterium]